MSLRRAWITVAASGAVVVAVAALGLGQVGGPAESRREDRDARRLGDLQAISEAVACHIQEGAPPDVPAALSELSAACLAPGRAADLVDPGTGDAYALSYPTTRQVSVCAAFERAAAPGRYAPPSFNPATGCLIEPLPNGR